MKIDCSTVEIDKIKENEHVAARYRHNGIPGNRKGNGVHPVTMSLRSCHIDNNG